LDPSSICKDVESLLSYMGVLRSTDLHRSFYITGRGIAFCKLEGFAGESSMSLVRFGNIARHRPGTLVVQYLGPRRGYSQRHPTSSYFRTPCHLYCIFHFISRTPDPYVHSDNWCHIYVVGLYEFVPFLLYLVLLQ